LPKWERPKWELAKWERLKRGRDRRRQADGGSGERRGAGVCVCVCVCVCVKRAVNLDARNGSTPVPSRALRRVRRQLRPTEEH
jgi:hypothetical protein